MPRIFVPIESVTIAHVVRPLQVAQRLRAEGVEVIFGSDERYRSLIEKEGFSVVPLYCADPEMLLDCVRRVNFKRQNATLADYLKADLEAIGRLGKLDLVLSDFRFMARFAAEHLGVPHAALVNGFFSPYYAIDPELPRAILPGLPPWIRRNRALRRVVRSTVPRFHAGPYRKTCRKFGVQARVESGFDFSVSSTLTLICDLPEFTPQQNMPGSYHFTGPILWEPAEGYSTLPPDMNLGKRPLIYVSLGTSGSESAFRTLIECLGKMPYDVVLSTGHVKLGSLPPNIVSAPFVKPSGILEKAVLMICHGGNGTIYQALNQGVPVLCLPSFYDQEWNSQRVKTLGLGDYIFHADLSRELLERKVLTIVKDPGMRRRAEIFRDLIRQKDGAAEAAGKILSFIQSRSAVEAAFFS